ncbi:MAG TPA: phytoene/squalene synthase family protein [Pseudomonas xinjiangensis]|uniref:Phytoene/squalene synthase family protein n=2 Tax=root TaxID=1 RepID=A0A7V1FSQ3_9GAMM|nr:phytoene/squalene synthase family protein [Halopseudomonas xinjiangensis]HEC47302.1 phytoene/squalene synthase family protein [Halopseudomonas xinjiangensis]
MNQALLDHATQTIEVGSKSFAAAAKLFDPQTRRSAVMLYAWCRYCDDVVDGQHLGFGQTNGSGGASQARLAELENATLSAYAGEMMVNPAFAAFQEVIQHHQIPQRYPLDHLRGFAMDVEGRRYEVISDTLEYCYHVAGVVGLMMAMIMGARDAATLDRACDLGLAFQLTNIARDIVEDAAIGRCYVPAQWLRDAQIPETELAEPQHRVALAGVAQRLVDLAEPYYESALQGLPALPLRSAWAIATAHGVYREIGVKVKALGHAAWDQRVSTSKLDKARLVILGGALALKSRGQSTDPRHPLWQRPN